MAQAYNRAPQWQMQKDRKFETIPSYTSKMEV